MGTIYFFAEDVSTPSGGILAMYRFVDTLTRNGYSASILHRSSKFRCPWFTSTTPISGADKTVLTTGDVLVLTELEGHRISQAAPGVSKIILNNHQYWTFLNGNAEYRDPSVRLVLSVSQDGKKYLEFAFPGLKVDRIHYGIDSDIFKSSCDQRQRRIVYRGSKNPFVTSQIEKIWYERNRDSKWTLHSLTTASHDEVVSIMSSSAIFLATSQYEGFQIMAAEAMLAGMLVVGFHAGGGQEFLNADTCLLVEQGNIQEFVRSIESAMAIFDHETSKFEDITRMARSTVQPITSPEIEEADVLRCFPPILESVVRKSERSIGKLNLPEVSRSRRVARQLRQAAREFRG